MLIIIVKTSYFNDLTISLKIKKLIFAKIRPGKSSVPLSDNIIMLRFRNRVEVQAKYIGREVSGLSSN